ncbi:MAG: heavy metal translocating P-type ATPase [Alphaproteobacteria bacterium]|nr:heavy metal translocating P-type ATPase [Alphaproteobacteria bacterium]
MSEAAAIARTPSAPAPPAKPGAAANDIVRQTVDGSHTAHLMVEGLHCANCQHSIESSLAQRPGVLDGRVNLTTQRLFLRWDPMLVTYEDLAEMIEGLGFRLLPFDLDRQARTSPDQQNALLRAMAVAGFAAANIMLLSVALWAGEAQDMLPATRRLLALVSALIAIPAVAYAGRPFFASALAAVRGGAINMDVPIALALLLTTGLSFVGTMHGSGHIYFESATMLLFFLLIGRYLDERARGRVRSAAERLFALQGTTAIIVEADGSLRAEDVNSIALGSHVLVRAGERVPIDGTVTEGASDIDASLITGEANPAAVKPGACLYAGMVNLTGTLTVRTTATGDRTLLAEIQRLLEASEQRRSRYVDLAMRIVRVYAPVVHLLAAATFIGWWQFGGLAWQDALVNAVAVLIITCPCALALAVPVVQVVACNKLFKSGVLIKSPTALERLAQIDTIVFDKTGTLTTGDLKLTAADDWDESDLALASSLAASSTHPLARALRAAASDAPAAKGVEEVPGRGLQLRQDGKTIRLGSREWCGGDADEVAGCEFWLNRPGRPPVRFGFVDRMRDDARDTVAALKASGHTIALLSGDRAAAVAAVAERAGITEWQAQCVPAGKVARLEQLRAKGRRVCMIGDGLNDAPALAAAHASISPSTAADISQTAADVVFQGDLLGPVDTVLRTARSALRIVRQNFALALLYNAVTIPLAMAGLVTPIIAAASMSASSVLVVVNALRLGWGGVR